ncbi:DUF1990 family protein [Psychromicrobium sp. YIM B11713]|uniref:DUF1990 family protein n=1 Tax=Psychromicrobium sp. YIM B11713 TaxID=3145233 RepID=UPI00374F3271
MTEDFSYSQVGLSRSLVEAGPASTELWPQGYRRVFQRIEVGHGPEVFERLSESILNWGIQRGAGLRPQAEGPATVGNRVVCGFGWGPLRLPVPCRVVWSDAEDPRLRGFGYGTLPGHPARGEEAFVAELADDSVVHFSVLAFSKPAPGIYTLGAPVSQLIQRVVTARYLRAARDLAGGKGMG